MKRLIFSLFTVFCLCSISVAQKKTLEISAYDWGKPLFETDRFENKDTAAVHVLKSNTMVEYAYNEKGGLDRYFLVHEKVKINNNAGLEQYKSLRLSGEIMTMKARFIGKNGKIIEIDQSSAKTLEDEDGAYLLLAIEGAEVGGIIEYYWTKRGVSKLSGSLTLQSKVPQSNVSLSVITPINLQFAAKSYNGCPEMQETVDSLKEIRMLSLYTDEIPALEREEFSFRSSHLQRVEYSFANNTANKRNISNVLNDELQSYYKVFRTFDPKELKLMQPVWKKMDIKNNMPEEKKIRIIENHIKTNFQWIEGGIKGVNISQIPDILKTSYANTFGYLRLLTVSFDHFNIPFELVFTGDRKKRFFDKDFKGNNYWDEILVYFPSLDTYLDPGSMFSRLGQIESSYLGNNGMFLKEIKAGGIGTYMPYYKQIAENDYEKSNHATNAHIKLDAKDFKAKYTVQHQFTGYTADFLQPFFYYTNDEKKKDMVERVIVEELLPDQLLSWKVENQEPIDWFVKPLTIKAELSGNSLISRGGNDILVRIGVLIGKQVEMYQEKVRKLPLESESTRMYVREITMEIPEGYTLSNPEVIKMKKELPINGNVEAFFYSDYAISGNKLTVTCSEGYKKMTFPASLAREYIDVTNAAADFNKITLILVPK